MYGLVKKARTCLSCGPSGLWWLVYTFCLTHALSCCLFLLLILLSLFSVLLLLLTGRCEGSEFGRPGVCLPFAYHFLTITYSLTTTTTTTIIKMGPLTLLSCARFLLHLASHGGSPMRNSFWCFQYKNFITNPYAREPSLISEFPLFLLVSPLVSDAPTMNFFCCCF